MGFDLDSVRETVGDRASEAREKAEDMLEENEETIDDLREAAQEVGELSALGGKAAAAAVRTTIEERYSDDPEQLRDDMGNWAAQKSDAVVQVLGWTDSQEFMQAHGYEEPSLDAFDHWGDEPWENDYDDVHTALADTVIEADDRPVYPVEETDHGAEYMAQVAAEAYARENGVDDADFVLYHVDDVEEPADMLTADIHLKFYSEGGRGIQER